ncbi:MULTISPECIES: cytochrome C oxidase subunit IV family protein [unclassified Sinorhizobium]|uniref:cytochrome C oxidase subunit IV family protein n=1 Tax=unclassified Sinorhizobium TaxID=2613772 RepID=UPI003525572C
MLSSSLFRSWIALMLLLAATVVSSFVLTGLPGLTVNLMVAFAKTGIIFWIYMHLNEEPGLSRIAALGAGCWFFVLLAFLSLDYLTRP